MTEQMYDLYEDMFALVSAGATPEQAAEQCNIKPDPDETGYDDDYSELVCKLASDYLLAQSDYTGDNHYLDYLAYTRGRLT